MLPKLLTINARLSFQGKLIDDGLWKVLVKKGMSYVVEVVILIQHHILITNLPGNL